MPQYYYNPFGNGSDVDGGNASFMLKAQQAKEEKHKIRMISLSMGCAIIAYLVVQSVLSTLLVILGLDDLYNSSAAFQYEFTIVGVSFASVAVPFGVMALINKKNYESSIIPSTPIKPSRLVSWTLFGIGACLVANISVSVIVQIIKSLTGLELKQGDIMNPSSVYECVMLFIGVAIIPAICEEFAMRCCSLRLLQNYGKGFAVLAVSIVFGLLHGNVVQFIFATVMGLVLGFVTIRTDSIIPAVLIHATNNGVSVIQMITEYAGGKKLSDDVVTYLYIALFVLSVIATIYLFFKKEFKKEKGTAAKSVLTFGQKMWAFLFPCQIVPFIILIVLTVMSIKK